MPIVRIEMLKGRTLEQKEALVETITNAMTEIAKIPREHVWVIIDEVSGDNWAAGGVLLSKRL